jgi:L-asparaginase
MALAADRKILRHGATGKHRTMWVTMSLLLLMMCVCAFGQELPKVVVLSTGGTIASKQDPVKGGYVPVLSGEDLVAAVPAIKKIAQIQVEQISNIPSPDMTPEIWLRLAGRVNELLAKPEIVGIVVTHGTDTLEETAYFLDLTTVSVKPVILVGAQRPASDSDSDGPRNLLDAIRVAIAPEAPSKGVMVVMNGQISAARDVTKTNTNRVETFRGLEFGQLGWPTRKRSASIALRCSARRSQLIAEPSLGASIS